MKLNPAQLGKHLQGALASVYVVSGDEALLCQEACDAIRAATREQQFSERQVFNAEANFDWGNLLQAGASMSLFAEKRLLELRLPSGKPGDKGAAPDHGDGGEFAIGQAIRSGAHWVGSSDRRSGVFFC